MKNIHSFSTMRQNSKREAGVALILALICALVISMLAIGVIFATQTEIQTSGNYRATAQARYVAEAGAQQTINWIIQNWTAPALTDTTKFNLNIFPVKYVGGANPVPVVLAGSNMGITDTYSSIDSATDGAFTSALQKQFQNNTTPFTALNNTAKFNVAVQLLSATQSSTLTGGQGWLTKWKIISQASVGRAKVQVVEIMADVPVGGSASTPPTPTIPNFNYAVLATGTGCNVIQMTGGQYTNAYDHSASGNPGNSNPKLLGNGGSVASFGNINIQNGAYINGNVFSPYYNVGAVGTSGISCPPWTAACGSNSSGWNWNSKIKNGPQCSSPSNIWSVSEDNSGSAVGCTSSGSCSQTVSNLPPSLTSPASVPTPTMPSVTPNTSACSALPGGLCNGGNGGSSCAGTLPPSPAGTSYGQVNFGSCAVITLQPGVYNFDTLLISNGAKINLPNNGAVVINILNSSNSSTPFTSNGGTVINGGGDPNNLSFVYAGSNAINLNNGSAMFATVYAPNASVTVSGNGGLFGAVVGKTFNFSGSGHVVYDTKLGSETPPFAPPPSSTPSATTATAHLDEFSWSTY